MNLVIVSRVVLAVLALSIRILDRGRVEEAPKRQKTDEKPERYGKAQRKVSHEKLYLQQVKFLRPRGAFRPCRLLERSVVQNLPIEVPPGLLV